MPLGRFSQRASHRGALFACGPTIAIRTAVLAAALLLSVPAPAAPQCPPDRIDAQARVKHVLDGDTIELDDGRRLRLIGLNTPEIGHDGAPSEPFAIEARDHLQRLLAGHGNRIALRYDRERTDNYQRTLAHLFLADGTSITAELLEQGLGAVLVVPPNVWNAPCYQQAERRAQARQQGIWALPSYQPVRSDTLRPYARGFRVVKGRVERIGGNAKSIWLHLTGPLALRIDREDLPYFDSFRPDMLQGRTVVARGWLYTQKDGLRMQVRHPAALEVVP